MMAQEVRQKKKPTGRPKGAKAIKQYVRTTTEQRHDLVEKALVRYQGGELLEKVANDMGVSRATLYAWMLNEVPDQYKMVQKDALITRLAETYQKIEEATEQIDLARARELRRAAQWDAERRLSKLFAQKQEVSVDVTHNIGDRLIAARSRVIDHAAPQSVQRSKRHNEIEDAVVVKESKG